MHFVLWRSSPWFPHKKEFVTFHTKMQKLTPFCYTSHGSSFGSIKSFGCRSGTAAESEEDPPWEPSHPWTQALTYLLRRDKREQTPMLACSLGDRVTVLTSVQQNTKLTSKEEVTGEHNPPSPSSSCSKLFFCNPRHQLPMAPFCHPYWFWCWGELYCNYDIGDRELLAVN